MPGISQVLNRRSDLSTFLVHLTRSTARDSARVVLTKILDEGRIAAATGMGWGMHKWVPSVYESQRVACFTEAPLEQIHGLFDIDGRRVNLEPYGVVFTRMVARRKGANPVWYVDTTEGHPRRIKKALDSLLEQAMPGGRPDPEHPAWSLFPFFEEMGISSAGNQKEFWWEREWRHTGDFKFERADIALIVAPEAQHGALKTYGRPCVDAAWSLEGMVAALAGLRAADVTPFSV